MLAIILKLIAALVGVAGKWSDASIDRARIQADIDKSALDTAVRINAQQADVIKAGMAYKVFWVVWAIAAVPMAAWFGWGMLDTLANGALPDVAVIPPGLAPYADAVWQNVFYTGAAGAITQGVATTIAKVLKAKR